MKVKILFDCSCDLVLPILFMDIDGEVKHSCIPEIKSLDDLEKVLKISIGEMIHCFKLEKKELE
jgi:hypothetical protein